MRFDTLCICAVDAILVPNQDEHGYESGHFRRAVVLIFDVISDSREEMTAVGQNFDGWEGIVG